MSEPTAAAAAVEPPPPTRRGRWRRALGLCGLLLIAIAVRRAVAAHPDGSRDDGLGGQDPWAYLDAARQVAAFWADAAGPPEGLFWPLGYPALAAAVAGVAGVDEARALRVVSLGLSAAAAPLTALLVMALRPEARLAPWIAGGVVAIGAAAALAGAAVMADGPMLGLLALAGWLAAAARRRPGLAPLAALALGLALVTRQAAWVAAPALAAAAGVALLQARRDGAGSRPVLLALTALGLALPLALQAAYGGERPAALDHAWVRGWRPWHAVQASFATVDGAARYAWPQGAFALFVVMHPGYLAPPGLLAVAAGVRALRADPFALTLTVGWLATAVLLFAGMPYQNFRFGLCALPPAAALAGLGFEVALDRWRRGRGRGLVLAGLLLCLAWTAAWTPRMAARHLSARRARHAEVATIAAAATAVASADVAARRAAWGTAPRPPTVVAFDVSLDLRHRHGLDVVDLSTLDAATLAQLRAAAASRPLVLVIDPGDLAGQWRGTAIAAAHERLRAAFDVGPARQVGPYRVARLEPR